MDNRICLQLNKNDQEYLTLFGLVIPIKYMTFLQLRLMQDIQYHVWQQMIILFLLDPRKFIYNDVP